MKFTWTEESGPCQPGWAQEGAGIKRLRLLDTNPSQPVGREADSPRGCRWGRCPARAGRAAGAPATTPRGQTPRSTSRTRPSPGRAARTGSGRGTRHASRGRPRWSWGSRNWSRRWRSTIPTQITRKLALFLKYFKTTLLFGPLFTSFWIVVENSFYYK